MKEIVILGAGMAGLGANYQINSSGVHSTIYEKRARHGGNCSSHVFEGGFLFDEGPHLSFTEDERIQALFAESVNNEFEAVNALANNYWKGHWIKHPAQCNLHGLPADLVVKILKEFIEIRGTEPPITNYSDWLEASFGKTFAETFPKQYCKKFHTVSAENMSTDWIGPRLYRPAMEEILYGAVSPTTPNVHYITKFRYPTHNGYVSFLNMFKEQADIKLEHEIIKLDPRKKEVTFTNGKTVLYDGIISSIPLPELIPMIVGTPKEVLEATRNLACTTCVLVNIGINRSNISEAQWTYFYDDEIIFTRLSYSHTQSPYNVPKGCGSIQAEIYFSDKYKPLRVSPNELIAPVIRDLRKCGLLKDEDNVVFTNTMVMQYANVIFDLDRSKTLSIVHGYLDDMKIGYCGRYGEWGYLWSDQSFKSGEEASLKILDVVLGG